MATDISEWPNGLHFPRGNDTEVEWSLQRAVLRHPYSKEPDSEETGKTSLCQKADIDNAVVSWHFICHEGKPQASFGPTLRKLEEKKLLEALANHCSDNCLLYTSDAADE